MSKDHLSREPQISCHVLPPLGAFNASLRLNPEQAEAKDLFVRIEKELK